MTDRRNVPDPIALEVLHNALLSSLACDGLDLVRWQSVPHPAVGIDPLGTQRRDRPLYNLRCLSLALGRMLRHFDRHHGKGQILEPGQAGGDSCCRLACRRSIAREQDTLYP